MTILLVKHLVKGVTAKAVHKVSGSAGYVNSVRAAFVVAPDAEDDAKKLFLPLKFNLGPKPSGLQYALEPVSDVDQQRIVGHFPTWTPRTRAGWRSSCSAQSGRAKSI